MAAPVNGLAPTASSRWVSYVLVVFGMIILILFAATTNVPQLGDALRGVRPGLLVAAGAAIALQILVKATRWRYMIKRLTGTAISTRFAAISIAAGVAAGSVAPARSFEMAKAMLLKGSHDINLGVSTSAMIVERMLDLMLWIGVLLLAALLLPRRMVVASGILLATIAVLVVGSALVVTAPLHVRGWAAAILRIVPSPTGLRTRALRLLDVLFESILLWRHGRTLGALLALSGLSAALDLTRVCAVFWGMGAALSVPFLAFTYIGAAMLGMALLIPGGVGVTEVSQVGLITLLAPGVVPSALIRSAVLVDRFLSYYLITLIGAALLIAYHRYRRAFH